MKEQQIIRDISSPHTEKLAEFEANFNDLFLEMFNLEREYSRSEVSPGERFGFIDWHSQEDDSDFGSPSFEKISAQFILTFGAKTKHEIDKIASIERNNITHNLALIRDHIKNPEIVWDLAVSGQRVSSKCQNIVPPNHWIVDIAGEFTAKIFIYKDLATGKHLELPSTSNS